MFEADQARLRAANQAFRRMPKEVKNDLRKYQRAEAGPIWKQEVSSGTGITSIASRTFKSGNTVKAGAVIMLKAGGSNKKLSGGATPAELVRPAEFGTSRRNAYTKYHRKSPNGKVHTVTRRTSRPLPTRRRGGYVVYPAAGRSTKRIVSLSVQTITRRIYDSVEGG
jgi:hypothetical protein